MRRYIEWPAIKHGNFFVLFEVSVCIKGDKCLGGKQAKEQLTLFFREFMSGEKRETFYYW